MKTRVLIIDDEPRWIDFVKHDLSKSEITVARDASEALKYLARVKPDLVIVSSRRLDVLRIIKEKYALKRVVVSTIKPSTQEALTAYRLGALRYFPKSFAQHNLLDLMQEVIPSIANAAAS